MGKDLIVDKFYQMIDHLNEKRIIPVQFCLININKLKPLYDGMEEHLINLLIMMKQYFIYCIKYRKFTKNNDV